MKGRLLKRDPEELVLDVANLRVRFFTPLGVVRAVNGVSLSLAAGRTLAVLGESGSGKSVTARAISQLVQEPPGRVEADHIRVSGTELIGASRKVKRDIRGSEVAMIFQDATRTLNPGLSVGYQMAEVYRRRKKVSKKDGLERVVDLLQRVGISSPEKRIDDYPHQLSGGMSQRVMIAMSLMMEPKLLIADEPTTALDVTVQAQIMTLLQDLQEQLDMALLLITHDIAVAGEVADEVAVMYAGRIVEHGDARDVLTRAGHPYTRALMSSIPRAVAKGHKLHAIEGAPPVMTALPDGCSFHPRCGWAEASCREIDPVLEPVTSDSHDHRAACQFREQVRDRAATEVSRSTT